MQHHTLDRTFHRDPRRGAGSHLCVVVFRFTLVQKHTVEFNQVAMANSEGSEVMLNRVMTKDNIGVAALLEVNKEMFSGGKTKLLFCGIERFRSINMSLSLRRST